MYYLIYSSIIKWILITPLLYVIKHIIFSFRLMRLINDNVYESIIYTLYLLAYLYIFNEFKIINNILLYLNVSYEHKYVVRLL